MKNKDLKTLKEVQSNLFYISEVFESVRKKLSIFDTENLEAAQNYIINAIEMLKKGIKTVEVNTNKENTNGDETTR